MTPPQICVATLIRTHLRNVRTQTAKTAAKARPAEMPTADDNLATLCTDKACAKALGLSGKVTMREVRRNYRQRIAEYHPDKVAHLGSKLRAVAEMESKRLNIAYQYFQERYGQKA